MKRRGRPSPREFQQAKNAAFRFYGIPQFSKELKPLRKRRKPGADGRPLERNVLRAVMQALRMHPSVASVERNQSGVFQEGNRVIRIGSRGKLDLTVYLRDGRYIEIEVKRSPDVKLLSEAQLERIRSIRANHGLAGWCWSVESAIALIP